MLEMMFTGMDFEPSDVSLLIKKVPTRSYKRGEQFGRAGCVHQECCWEYDSGYQIDISINDILDSYLKILSENKREVLHFIKQHSIQLKFCIVGYVEYGAIPPLHLTNEQLCLISELGGRIESDMYYNHYPTLSEQIGDEAPIALLKALEHGKKEEFMSMLTSNMLLDASTDLDQGWEYLQRVYKGELLSVTDDFDIEVTRAKAGDGKYQLCESKRSVKTTEGLYFLQYKKVIQGDKRKNEEGITGIKVVRLLEKEELDPLVQSSSWCEEGIWFPEKNQEEQDYMK